ncbi:MAG: glycosyltransferase [Deltaproteobacteria bacterium]|nr:glycosyltransferase [Deltaproteobacteria bacterium]
MHFPIRLLLVIDELDIGGTEQQIFELVRKIDRRKYLPMVCCFRPGRIAKEIEALGVRVFVLPKRNKFDLQLLPALVQLLRRERIDLIQTYLFTANTWARVAAIVARVPLIVTSERNVTMWEERYKQILGKFLDRWTHRTIANSSAVKEYLVGKGIAAQKTHVISNGVDPDRFADIAPNDAIKKELGLSPDHRVVSMIVRLEPAKDVSTFLRAAALVAQRRPDVSFLIVGGGSQQNELEREAAQLGLHGRLVFTGLRRDVPRLLSISDVSALSSLKEGMSNTIMESMAAGKPMVATQVGGNVELIVDGETGFLVPPRNPEAFADALHKLLADPDGARRMGKRAQERIIQLFSAEALVAKTERLYDELVGQAPMASTRVAAPSLHDQAPTVAFIVSQFPRYVDAYFLREVAALAARGLRFQIFSLLNFKGKVVHKDAQTLLPRTVYIPFFFSLALWQAHAHFLRQTPGRYLNALWTILLGCWQSPRSLAKALAVFPKSVYFAKLVQDQQLAHVHANWASHPAVSALIITQLTGVSWSFAGHASDIFLDTTMLREKIRAAKFVVTCTRYNKEYLTTVGGPDMAEKIVANYHGVDLTTFVPVPRQSHARFTILAVGTLLPCKGLPDLIAACRILQQRRFDFECIIAGDGPERQALEKSIQQNGVTEHVKILGYVSQEALIPLYQQADVVALPALLESHFGIPNVLLEAMAVETPVICTPMPSLIEVLEDGHNGMYVPEHSPEALAEALVTLMQNPALRNTMGKAGRRKIEELFDTEKNVDVLASLFQPAAQQPTVAVFVPLGSAAPASIEHSPTTPN